ncbi:AAEL014672-PA [Aedes aegypti]|uniref:AAEL014672-PA n=1 Tax=Aedes aegypti TaxID=7159 RepID=Q16FQ5_AEDAE|nr:AAEL014672-PA [Aedes aegypti]
MGFIEAGRSQYLTNTVHKTPAASEKVNELSCYSCNATEDGESCIDLTGNNASFVKKCFSDEFICMVNEFHSFMGCGVCGNNLFGERWPIQTHNCPGQP